MRKSMVRHGISVLILAALIALCFGSATTDGVVAGVFSEQQVLENIEYKEVPVDELESNIATVSADGHGFIVKAYVSTYSGYLFKSDRRTFCMKLKYTQDFLTKYPDVHKQLEEDRQYTFYVAVHNLDKDGKKGSSSGGSFHPNRYEGYITKIDGLRSVVEVTAAKEAAAAAKKAAAAAELEKKQNPKGLNRSLYKEVAVEDFSFDMVAGNLKVGAKVCFKATFYTKPTGTSYKFDDVNLGITLTSDNNFVRDMPDGCFGPYQLFGVLGGPMMSQSSVKIFVTVKKSGQYGECSVDIVEW